MDEQIKITIRLDAALGEQFQAKLKRGGWSATKLLTQLIRDFVEREEKERHSTPESFSSGENFLVLNQELCGLNQRIEQIEKTLLLLSLMQKVTFSPHQQQYLLDKLN